MIRKTSQNFQVNQPRPASLPPWISDAAWAFLESLSPSLCVTLHIDHETDDEQPLAPTAIRMWVAGTHEGKHMAMDGQVWHAPDPKEVTSYMACAQANFRSLDPTPAPKADGIREALVSSGLVEAVSGKEAADVVAASVHVVPTPKKKRGSA